MGILNIRSLLLAAIVICDSITWTSSKHHYTHNVNGHRSRHRRQGAGLFLSSSYVIPGGEGSGAWGDWGAVSPCSRTCGGGVASQKRICLEIGPDGRSHCTGGDTKYFSCETQDCPEGAGDFRAEQCAAFNDKLFRNNRYNWVPYKELNPCELNCMPVGERFYYRQKEKVIDGTRCRDDTFDVCVNGTCQPVGCDMMLGSNAREDKCRQCRGNGSNCHTVSGIIDTQELKKGYTDILLIPEGATNIVIAEVRNSDNYLALRGRENNHYYLNGDFHIDFPRTLTIAGSLWHYERSERGFAAPDKLRCLGPTNESLYVSLLLQTENVGVEYEYSVPSALAPPPNQQYQWAHEEFSECSEPCGGGYQTRQVSCRTRDDLELVEDELCDSNFKPVTNQSCNTQACGPQWVKEPWGSCSKPCGQGGTRSRYVYCQKIIFTGELRSSTIVADEDCLKVLGPKPEQSQPCNQNETCPTWFTGPWKPCDKLCGEGKQRRQVVCYQKVNGRVSVYEDSACSDEKPASEQPCALHPCEGLDWVVSDWSGCDTCLSTVRTRTAWCVTKANELVNSSLCAYHPEPVLQEQCDKTKLPACEVQWYATQWSPCSSNCGKGVKTRKVFCGLFDGSSVLKVEDSRCDALLKYNDTVECEQPKEKCPAKWFAGPWSECTKKCGGGEQFRHVVCMSGGKESKSCEADSILFKSQPCNVGPCDMDEMLPLDSKSTTIIDEEDYDDCVEGEDEDYEEVGAEVIDKQLSTVNFGDIMFSDSPSTIEGSGTSETIDVTFTTETGSGSTETDTTLSEAIEGSGEDWSTSVTAETTESSESTSDSSTEPSGTTQDSTEATDSSSDNSESTVDISTMTTESSGSTDSNMESSESENTESTDDVSTVTTESNTEPSGSTQEVSTEESGGSTTTDSSTEPSGTSQDTEATDSSTENSESTVDISTTESSGSTDSNTESSASTLEVSTEVSESSASTTTDSSTEPSGTTLDITTDITDSSGSTSDSSTEPSETTLDITTDTTNETETTVTESSDITTEITSIATDSSISTTESTDTSSVETEETTVTESSDSSTVITETESSDITTELTDSSSASTESQDMTSETTDISGATSENPETTTEITSETSETGSTIEPSTTENISEGSTSTEESELTSEATTPWDWETTFITPRRCKPRKKAKCIKSKFGCCPDKRTPAAGPFDAGCPNPKTCKESKFGCCPDGLSPANGPRNKDCPVTPCNETLFGCCTSDNVTAAEGNDQEGCPPPPPACASSEFGCCKDDKTPAQGAHGKGCPGTETTTTKMPSATELEKDCAKTAFGCCYDNETDASGPNGAGCPCSISQFGCCPDGISTAVGPDMQGCVMSCNTSAYGCCPDGETPAHGPDFQGCCLLSAYGCCPDNYNAAQGPNNEGCDCQYARFGCCPDNATIARGPDYEGCGCKHTQFGCCPDRHTEATGPNMEGCGCHTYQFGCCADGETFATGPNQQGCRCEQSKYGCCGDGVTAARGPDKIGCDCSNSKYGCCPDGVTEAQGKKFLNCTDKLDNRQAVCGLAYDKGSCRNYTVYWFYDREYGGCSRFWYGGCEGNGNRFSSQEECEDICVRPPPKDACNLPMMKGSCPGYNVKWYYDAGREQCSQFVYSGCLGNNNKFDSRELCQKQCEPEKTEDQCNLPIERGPCAGNYLRYGYDADSRSCIEFVWGGCAGNNNRFSTETACLLRCNPPGVPDDKCKLAQDAGACTEKYPTWSFSQTENQCVPFYYTGCGGNDNRFSSERECAQSCPSHFEQDVCTLPALTGNCAEYTLRWFYDTTKKTCRQFYYGGCEGNENNFQTFGECENRCMAQEVTTTTVQPIPPKNPYTTEYCYMEADPGPCTMYQRRWAYDERRGSCYEFSYGGCGGNQNNFPSLEHCQYLCNAIKDVCKLPMAEGPCGEEHLRWFYDSDNEKCSQFVYGGCDGNDNRFNTRDECENRCRSGADQVAPPTTAVYTTTTLASQEAVSAECRVTEGLEQCVRGGRVWYYAPERLMCVSHDNAEYGASCRHTAVFPTEEACERACGSFRNFDVCRYGVNAGTCNAAIPKFFFNETSGSCEQFVYGGCHGGPNRFSTLEECREICISDPCEQPTEPGNCLDNIVQWSYDQAHDDCRQFIYSGCSGNDNRFETREECLGRCKKTPPVLTTTVSSSNPSYEAECEMPESLVPCGANETIYYYDPASRKCVEGNFGSCRHPNSYGSEEACERRCGAFRGLDVCGSRLDPGPCSESILKVYWDAAEGRCEEFAYGGCFGGPNRFSSVDECDEVCGGSGPEPECLLPVDSGRACAAQRRWYYSAAHADCLPFVYGGCAGNDNNFHSYGECSLRCKISNGEPEAPSADPSIEPRVSGVVGQPVTLRCLFHGNPPPSITWRRGEITIDGDMGRYRLLSDGALEIVSLYRNDSGVYICIGENELGRATQEIRLEVNDESTNEVSPPDCRAYVAECAALRCEFGVQTLPAGGCERCECVRPAVDCERLRAECDRLTCAYGTDKTVDDDGCERCRCIDPPCVNKACAADERCVTNVYTDPITNKRRYYAECRIANKTGYCPREEGRAADSQCHRQCNDDADCVGVGKCCVRGCSQLCLEPVDTSPTSTPPLYDPDKPQAPLANVVETEPEVTGTEGGKASLRCLFHGNPPPKIAWRRGQITIDGNADRYRVLSDGTLEIVALYRNDTGVYICIAENDLGRAMQEIRLEVNDPVVSPAGIADQSAVIVGDIGKPLAIRCLVYGFPKPTIFWYRGRNGPMVPFSSALYEARENTLLIRRLADDTLGEYICQTYNGIGKPAEWAFTVQSAASGGGQEPRPSPRPAPPSTPPPTSTRAPVYTVPVSTSISAAVTRLSAGAEINLPCAVDGYPVPEVHWTKDGVTVTTSDRMIVTDSRLTVAHASTNDSGTYGCHAANAYSSHHTLVQITVEGLYIPPTCKDNPYFANCHLIVRSKYCHHKYYSSFCCKSCVEAGLLDPSQLEMQADEPFWSRK